ncbi:hypothetical protein LEP1GSC052_4177 [Leptospira kmetyi serovar Malaysia str. Bejo-Iso9]|nr:hypothetical protein LEP1GSC052_4177 [Leptospira kmetyi serovar Malaysia str. Bejo-Iso9]
MIRSCLLGEPCSIFYASGILRGTFVGRIFKSSENEKTPYPEGMINHL